MPRGKREPWQELRLPNADSDLQTPASLKIDLHYAHLRIWDRWSKDRFVRLAAFLNLTLGELASLACISHRAIDSLHRRNRLYCSGSKDLAGAMVLTLLEHHVCSSYTKDTVDNPFPNLRDTEPCTTQKS